MSDWMDGHDAGVKAGHTAGLEEAAKLVDDVASSIDGDTNTRRTLNAIVRRLLILAQSTPDRSAPMVNFTSAAIPAGLTPQRPAYVTTTVEHVVDPSQLPSYPQDGDTIVLFTLPLGARVVDAFLRTTSCGAAGSVLQLQHLLNGEVVNLTRPLAADRPGTVGLLASFAPPPRDPANPACIQVAISGGALDRPGSIEVLVGYEIDRSA